MRLTIERDAALSAVARVKGVCANKAEIPILAFVLLEAGGDTLNLTATNTDMQARTQVACTADAAGGVAVPAGLFHDVLKSLPSGGEVGLELGATGGRLKIACGKTRMELPTLPASDFPAFPFGRAAGEGELGASVLARMIDNTRHAISTETTRFYLCGLFLHLPPRAEGRASMIRAVATNGAQLAWADAELPDGLGDFAGVILPRGLVGELRRHLDGGQAVTFERAEGEDRAVTLVRFRVGGIELTSKVIDGAYPDYPRAIPVEPGPRMRVSRALLKAAVGRALLVARDKVKTCNLRAFEGGLRVSASSYEGGTSADEVSAAYDGEPLATAFNGRLLAEVLEMAGADDIDLEFRDGGRILMLTVEADPDTLQVLVALKTGPTS